jgi:CubicO group peptidase (beta-lactamase class C family)
LERSVLEGITPGGVLALRGAFPESDWDIRPFGKLGVTRSVSETAPDDVYDLASVTKVLSTTFLAMIARDRGITGSPDSSLASFGWGGAADTAPLTLRNLLAHRSGLPAWRPLYLLGGGDRRERRAAARDAILRERPLFPQGGRTLYSDLGFILLGALLEELFGDGLDALFAKEIAGPLGLEAAGFQPLGPQGFARREKAGGGKRYRTAPTEDGFRCGGPLDWPGVPVLGPVPPGRVHDDNAAWLGGAAGHAGLFAAAGDAARIVGSFQKSFQGKGGLASRATAREFMRLQGPSGSPGRRGLGFDAAPRPSGRGVLYGHKGYTGATVWFDPEGREGMVLVCNRVHPTARRGGMEAFREKLATLAFPD